MEGGRGSWDRQVREGGGGKPGSEERAWVSELGRVDLNAALSPARCVTLST